MSRLSRQFRSPAVATVFAVVVGVAGIAIAGPGPHGSAEGELGGGTGRTSSGSGDGASEDHPASTGAEISEFATTTELTGWEKGAAISTLASGGRSQAGMHGPHAGEAANDPASQAQEHAEQHGGGGSGEVNPGGPPGQAPAQAGGPTRG